LEQATSIAHFHPIYKEETKGFKGVESSTIDKG
jgi:hypothetical protein